MSVTRRPSAASGGLRLALALVVTVVTVTALDCTPGMRHDNCSDSAVATMRYRTLFCANAVAELLGDYWTRLCLVDIGCWSRVCFADSVAISKSPKDLFRGADSNLITSAAIDGYLVEASIADLRSIQGRITNGTGVAVRCDISRTKSIRKYGEPDIYRGRTPESLWDSASEISRGRGLQIWLPPLKNEIARDQLFGRLENLQARSVLFATAARIMISVDGQIVSDQSPRANSLAVLQRDYRANGRARSLVEVPSAAALEALIASGSVYRIEPISKIVVTAPGAGEEPQGLPSTIGGSPIVGVVDGGCTARSYVAAEAWREPPYVRNAYADTRHGNQIASVIVHGHEWNNNLPLPELYCRIGVARAAPSERIAQLPTIRQRWFLTLNELLRGTRTLRFGIYLGMKRFQ